MTTLSVEMNTTETILENSLAIELDSQTDYTSLPMPPAPPSIEETSFIPGQFKYIKCIYSRKMLQNAYQAISQTENWNFVKKDIESFSFSSAPEIGQISVKMVELGYDGHSGFSFGWTMRQMQTISRQGEQWFKEIAKKW
jgi:hypothetical protein